MEEVREKGRGGRRSRVEEDRVKPVNQSRDRRRRRRRCHFEALCAKVRSKLEELVAGFWFWEIPQVMLHSAGDI